MKKIRKKLLIILTILFFLIILNVGEIFAFSVSDLTGTQVSNSDLRGLGNSIVTILTTIGSVVSVIVLIILGIKYMTGSVEEKAEYKKTMIPYLVGALLIFGASAIAKAVIAISENLTAGN